MKAAITEDDAAFRCETTDRFTGRAQNVLRGVITLSGLYTTGGIPCNFQKKTSRFPLGNMRVLLQLDATGTCYAVYNLTTKKILVYSDVGSEARDGDPSINGLIFPFLAAGE